MDRIEFYSDDRDDRVNFESPGSFAIVWVAFPYDRPGRLNIFFETTGTIETIRTILWKPGLKSDCFDQLYQKRLRVPQQPSVQT